MVTKKGSKKKAAKKKGGPGPKADDPPIMVGGGGSTLIWVRNDLTLTPIALNQVGAGAPTPTTPGNYNIYSCKLAATKNRLKKSKSNSENGHSLDSKTHSNKFDGTIEP